MMMRNSNAIGHTDYLLVRLQNIYMRMMAVAIIGMSGVGLVAQIVVVTSRGDTLSFTSLAPPVVLMLLGGMVLLFIEQRRLNLSARILIYSTVVASAVTVYLASQNPNILQGTFLAGSYLVIGTLAIITAAVLGTRFEHYISIGIVLGSAILVVIDVYQGLGNPVVQRSLVSSSFIIILTQVLVGGSLRFFVGAMQETHQSTRRANQLLEASAMVGQSIAQYLNADELYQQTVDIIRERFGYSQVQIYTVDEATLQGELRATTQPSADTLTAQQRLSFNAQSLIGRVARLHDTVTVEQTDSSEMRYAELSPTTRSAFMAPLLDNNRVIGILDVQSTQTGIFSQVEQQALKVLASQLATAIRNALLFEQQQHSVLENQHLLAESETSLVEIRRLNSTLTREAWEKYMLGREKFTGIHLSEAGFKTKVEWTDAMIESVKEQQPVVKKRGQQRVVAMPLLLRGETIGAIEVEIPPSEADIELELVDIIEGVGQRLAVSLDNARLFEEIQEASFNEQIISGIVTDFQSADTVESLLKTALEGLSSSLGAKSATIRMKQNPTASHYAIVQPATVSNDKVTQNGHANGHKGNTASHSATSQPSDANDRDGGTA
ncbi:MAG: hypothetical protein CL607_12140 [Anaerolineaceae bacterium]|nr:hypothetical protein [Anaerolineaceae bacterium]